MELLNLEDLVRDGKTDRTVVPDLDVLYISKKVVEIANDLQFARLAQRTSQLQIASQGGGTSHAPLQIGFEDGIHIEMVEMKVYVRGPIFSNLNVPVDVQLRGFELRAPTHMQVGALGHGLDCIVTHRLMIKGKVAQMDVRVNGRLFQRACGLSFEIHAAVHGYTASLKLGNTSEIKVVSVQIETESMRGDVV